MSTFGRQYTDAGLTSTLDHWLDEGPTSAPDMTVEAALRTAATTRQRQFRGRLLRMADFHGPVVPVSLTLAGISAVVLVAIGLGLNNVPPPGVENTPTPGLSSEDPAPTDIPYGYVTYRNDVDGYEIAIPKIWEVQVEPAYGEPNPGVTRFGAGDEDRPPLLVSVGATSGSVFLCQYLACAPEVARSLDDLEREIQSDWPLGQDLGGLTIDETIVDTTLGGEPARFRYPTTTSRQTIMGFETACSAYALHQGRPVVLTFSCGRYFGGGGGGEPAGLDQLEAIIASFRFLDDPSVSEADLETFSYDDLGFSVGVPATWEAVQTDPTLVWLHGPGGEVRIRAGGSDGSIEPCGVLRIWRDLPRLAGHDCTVASVTWEDPGLPDAAGTKRMADLVAGVMSRDGAVPAFADVITQAPAELGGAEAIRLMYHAGFCNQVGWSCWRYFVIERDGRPWIVGYLPSESGAGPLGDILRSFRFVD